MEIIEKKTVKHTGKAIRYLDQVNIWIFTQWASDSKGIVLSKKKDLINVDTFCEFNKLSLPALLGSDKDNEDDEVREVFFIATMWPTNYY